MKPIIHRHDGQYVCYRDKDRIYIDFVYGVGATPVDAYRDWLMKLPA